MLDLSGTFVHLRVHTSFSLCNGMISAKKLGATLVSLDVPAVAATDLNNLFGGFEFSQYVSGSGVQPIVGAEVSIHTQVGNETIVDNIVLLCQNEAGYINLSKIISELHLRSLTGSVDLGLIRQHSRDLICLWGGGSGIVSALPRLSNRRAIVLSAAQDLKAIFGDRLYVEIQRCSEPWEKVSEPLLLSVAYEQEIPIVATNDVYHLRHEDHYYQDLLQCIGRAEFEHQDDRIKKSEQHYLKSPAEMHALFVDLPEATQNTLEIARRCHFFVDKRSPILPVYPLDPGVSEDQELRRQALAGLQSRLKALEERVGHEEASNLRAKYEARFEFEFNTIAKMGFSGYFLIVSDFMTWAKEQRIPIGVRGSGATSIIAWCMNITHLDPIRFNLVFERFLNPERVSLPDFDVDFCQKRRPRVIEYVREKYGKDCVAQIITFGKLQAKAAIRDVGRVIQAPFPVVDKLAKLVGEAKDLKSALEQEDGLKELIESDSLAEKCFSVAQKLEGQYRHASTHAAGVIISDKPLVEYLPLYKDPSSDMPVTQFQYKDAESAGLVKFDFLGLRTLTIIATAIEYVHELHDVEIDVLELDFEDSAVFEMLANAETTGVFQLESAGMRDLVRNLKPTRIEHLIALISLYRPGPMDSIPSYIRRANKEEPVEYDHPSLESVLEETYGVITYQEDVMQIARELGGYSLGEADLLRRAMGKKIPSEMDAHQKKFAEGAVKLGVDAATAKVIFDKCAKFAGYGFNKGHAAAYSQVAYQTAYLKCHYPAEFYCACMTVDIEGIDRLKLYTKELKHKGIELLPPCVNSSHAEFAVQRLGKEKTDLAIRYGLAALKNVGLGVADTLVEERNRAGTFTSLENFFERVSAISVSKSVILQLIKAGALDSLSSNRGFLVENLDRLYDAGKSMSRAAQSDQVSLFAPSVGLKITKPEDTVRRPRSEDLTDELASIGFYLSGHPLDQYAQTISSKRYSDIATFKLNVDKWGSYTASVPCLIQKVQTRRSKRNGKKYGFLTLTDQSDDLEVMSFTGDSDQFVGATEEGSICVAVVEGELDETRTRFTLRSLQPLSNISNNLSKVTFHVPSHRASNDKYISTISNMLSSMSPGKCAVFLEVDVRGEKMVTIELPQRYSIDIGVLDRYEDRVTLA